VVASGHFEGHLSEQGLVGQLGRVARVLEDLDSLDAEAF